MHYCSISVLYLTHIIFDVQTRPRADSFQLIKVVDNISLQDIETFITFALSVAVMMAILEDGMTIASGTLFLQLEPKMNKTGTE